MDSKERKELLKTYMSYGLSKPFATAIVETANPGPILEFWKKEWHKQYPDADDVLVMAVLEQTITPDEGEWLNSVRSNHEDLIQFCLDGSCTIEWAKSLIEAGFLNHSREVSDILKGADPIVIGELSGIELQSDLLPPKLEMKKKNTEPIFSNIEHFLPSPPGMPPMPRLTEKVSEARPTIVANNECTNCKALVPKSVTKCPHCKFQLIWEWDRLSVQERESVGFFMRDFLPGITYQHNSALLFMQFLSTLSEDVTFAEFVGIMTNPQSEFLTVHPVENLVTISQVAHKINEIYTRKPRKRPLPSYSPRKSFGKGKFLEDRRDALSFELVDIRHMIEASKFWGRRY
jgi:hypothetical protein